MVDLKAATAFRNGSEDRQIPSDQHGPFEKASVRAGENAGFGRTGASDAVHPAH